MAKAKGMALVVVESPAKAKTINKILGKGFVVKASMGHVRDLPKKEFGIEISGDGKPTFEPVYKVLPEKKKTVDELKAAAKDVDSVYLACDFDREGEAIAWHVASILKLPPAKARRVVFNEITESAIRRAFEHPAPISMDRVNAQQARRILDRIVGYELSPLLWRKVLTGLSAGRVQSVAVRLIAEREKEIAAFKPEEYWKIVATVQADAGLGRRGEAATPLEERGTAAKPTESQPGLFDAELKKWEGEAPKLPNEAAARGVEAALKAATDWRVASVVHEEKKDAPDAPYRTATLQQQGSIRLHFSAKKTMMLAQQLYEGVELGDEVGSVGLITYMRTDSLNIAEEAIHECRDYIAKELGDRYLPEKARRYKSEAKGAQEAHEAIRPTSVFRTPDAVARFLTPDQLKLYRLIWERFVASQMKSAIYAVTTIEVAPAGERGLLRASGKVLKFDGHARISGVKVTGGRRAPGPESADEPILPDVKEGEKLDLAELKTTQHFTQPAPRFSEATLVKMLEKLGIGRPSTYAQIITTIQTRGYVKKEKGRFHCTDVGMIVTDKLVKHFGDIMETGFTSRMETELDEIEEAKRDWQDVLREFHAAFEADLARAKKEMKHVNQEAPASPFKCEKCGKPLLYKINRYGKYLACSGYPECSNTMGIDEEGRPKPKVEAKETEHVCEKCGSPMVIKSGRRGEFLACSAYPKCKNTRDLGADGKPAAPRKVETDLKCERCGKNNMVVRVGRRGPFLGCGGYPKCRNTRDLSPEELKTIKLPEGFAIAADSGAAGGGATREPPKPSGETCDKCGKPMVIRMSRRGPFQGCSGYPACKNAKPLPGPGEAAAGAGVAAGKKPKKGRQAEDDADMPDASELNEVEAET